MKNVVETPYGDYVLATGVVHRLPRDRRTLKGKMRAEVFEAIETLAKAAWELECDIKDIVPRRK